MVVWGIVLGHLFVGFTLLEMDVLVVFALPSISLEDFGHLRSHISHSSYTFAPKTCLHLLCTTMTKNNKKSNGKGKVIPSPQCYP